MKFLSWTRCLYLITIQKFIPLVILNNLININNKLLINFNLINLIFMSMVCSLIGLKTLNLKVLIAYSSIIQITWVVVLIYLNEIIFLNYLIIYFLIRLTLILIFNKFNLLYLNNLNLLKFQYKWIYLFTIIMIISMARIPPFLGFLIKWISIQVLFLNFSFYLIFFLILNSLIRIFFYLRIIFIRYLNYVYSIKYNFLAINYLYSIYLNLRILIWIILIMLLAYELF